MNKELKENDIRPQEHEEGLEKAIKEDLKRLKSSKKEFIKVNCPACGKNNYNFVFNKYGFNFVKCQKCRTIYMNPRATKEILNNFYSNSLVYDYWNKYIFPSSEKTRKEKIVRPRVKRILEICKEFSIPTNCLLEVGAGFGTFCQEIKKIDKFKRIIAIDPSSSCAKSCVAKNLEIIEDSIENINSLPVSPNVVVSFEVMEHLFSPEDFLMNCKKLMPKNSIIVIACPNFEGFDISTLGIISESIDHEHINLFNPDSIKCLFKRCGFEVIEFFTPGAIDADIVRNKIISNEYDVSGQPFLKTVLIDKWDKLGNKFQNFIKKNNLSSHMWIVGKKI